MPQFKPMESLFHGTFRPIGALAAILELIKYVERIIFLAEFTQHRTKKRAIVYTVNSIPSIARLQSLCIHGGKQDWKAVGFPIAGTRFIFLSFFFYFPLSFFIFLHYLSSIFFLSFAIFFASFSLLCFFVFLHLSACLCLSLSCHL